MGRDQSTQTQSKPTGANQDNPVQQPVAPKIDVSLPAGELPKFPRIQLAQAQGGAATAVEKERQVAEVYRRLGRIEGSIEQIDSMLSAVENQPELSSVIKQAKPVWTATKDSIAKELQAVESGFGSGQISAQEASERLLRSQLSVAAVTKAVTAFQQAPQAVERGVSAGTPRDIVSGEVLTQMEMANKLLGLLSNKEQLSAFAKQMNPQGNLDTTKLSELATTLQGLMPKESDLPFDPKTATRFWTPDAVAQVQAMKLLEGLLSDPQKAKELFNAIGGDKLPAIEPGKPWGPALQQAIMKDLQSRGAGPATPGQSVGGPASPARNTPPDSNSSGSAVGGPAKKQSVGGPAQPNQSVGGPAKRDAGTGTQSEPNSAPKDKKAP